MDSRRRATLPPLSYPHEKRPEYHDIQRRFRNTITGMLHACSLSQQQYIHICIYQEEGELTACHPSPSKTNNEMPPSLRHTSLTRSCVIQGKCLMYRPNKHAHTHTPPPTHTYTHTHTITHTHTQSHRSTPRSGLPSHHWKNLIGEKCQSTYTSPWAETITLVHQVLALRAGGEKHAKCSHVDHRLPICV